MKRILQDKLHFWDCWMLKDIPFTGTAYEEYDDGTLMSEVDLIEGMEYGLNITYYPNGKIETISSMVWTMMHGYSYDFYENGNLHIESLMEYGIRVKQKQYKENGEVEYTFSIDKDDFFYSTLLMYRKKNNWEIDETIREKLNLKFKPSF